MRWGAVAAVILLGAARSAAAFDFAPAPPLDTKQVDPALLKDMFGTWEIRDKVGRKRCRIVLLREPAIGGMGIEIGEQCAKAYPAMGDVAAWRLLEGWTVDLIDPLRKTRIRFETPDNRYVAFGEPSDIAGMDDLVKLPDAAQKPHR
ncbi:MAG: AprI/Inh family metalloprotease inhibitor [Pseudolabrys sp.]